MSTIATNVLAIMLHGVGSNGADFAPLANSWKASLPSAVFVSPTAPAPSSFGSGYQWFSVAGVTEDNRSARIADARRSFDQVISSIVEGNGFTDKLDRFALVGFSGRLASLLPLQPALETPILLRHRSADPVIPTTESSKTAAILQSLGLKVETLTLPGMPHTISADGAAQAGRFLADILVT
ncbi:phospholipase [Agrobacterium vitis]|uniref:phospholipase n=1 Tax=Agrobacterium vitis TaxID=373 RepID=UPI0018D24CA5|nr:phospholipase [Agrobacterium vitis]